MAFPLNGPLVVLLPKLRGQEEAVTPACYAYFQVWVGLLIYLIITPIHLIMLLSDLFWVVIEQNVGNGPCLIPQSRPKRFSQR
jgi:hypothetical protein